MLPICYEVGLTSGHVVDAAQFMSVATETFIKEVLSSMFSKTRSNGPGSAGSAGTGGGASWIQTHKYRAQLEREEELSLRGDMQRDKSGLLPIEAKAASERGPLGMADMRMALELGDCGLGQMPVTIRQVLLAYREGEVESWDEFSWLPDYEPGLLLDNDGDVSMSGVIKTKGASLDIVKDEDIGWEGCSPMDKSALDTVLDMCLAI